MVKKEDMVRCILCGKEMKKILQNNDDFRIHSKSYDHQGNYYNLFCDKCKEKDFMMRIQAIIRLNKINTAKNIYKSQAVRLERTNQKRFERWVLQSIRTTNKEYLGHEYIKDKFKEIKKEVQTEIDSKIRRKDRYQEDIEKIKLLKKQKDESENKKLDKTIKKLQHLLKTELKKEEGKFIFPKNINMNCNG